MPLHLETTADDEVAIIRGLVSDDALERLARDLMDGPALDRFAGIVVDLGAVVHSPHTLDALERASVERLRRHQLVSIAPSSNVDEMLERVLRWRQVLAAPTVSRLPIVHELATVAGTALDLFVGSVRSALRFLATKVPR